MSAERLAEITWECHAGNYESLKRIILAQNGSWDAHDDGTQIAHTPMMTVGFCQSDPITTHVQVCFALFGQFWPLVPEAAAAQRLVNKRWREQTKAKKNADLQQQAKP